MSHCCDILLYGYPKITMLNLLQKKGITVMKILMVCSAGMSSSLVSDRVQNILDSRNDGSTIIARPQEAIRSLIDEVDCVLVAPQMKYLFKDMEKLCSKHGKPVAMIDLKSYGGQDANAIMKIIEDCITDK